MHLQFLCCLSICWQNQPLVKPISVYSMSAPLQLNVAGEIHTTLLTGFTLNYDQKAYYVSLDSSLSCSQGEHFIPSFSPQMQYTAPSSTLAADLSSYFIETIKTIKKELPHLFSTWSTNLPISVSMCFAFSFINVDKLSLLLSKMKSSSWIEYQSPGR